MLTTIAQALVAVWFYRGIVHAEIVTPCTFNGTISNSIDAQTLDDTGYFCLGPVGTLYEDENKVPSFKAQVVLQESPKITQTLGISNLYTKPSAYATQVGTCDCVNQDVAWKAEHLPLYSDLAIDVIRKITESEPTLKKFDPVSSGTPCDFTRFGKYVLCIWFKKRRFTHVVCI